jgi:hypothetical protein
MRARYVLWSALLVLGAVLGAPEADAAAEIHRFNLVLSSIPTEIKGGGANDVINDFNRTQLRPRGLESLDEMTLALLHTAELRYFVRPNVAVSMGVGQLRSQTKREFLPALGQSIQLRAEFLSAPVYAGAAYYLAPYTQGDFQARAYLGGGFVSQVYNKAVFQQTESGTDGTTTLGGNFLQIGTRDAPGYYVEAGAHMWFPLRYSVMLSVVYRGGEVRDLLDQTTHEPLFDPEGRPLTLDLGGIGGRMGISIGL